MRELIAFSRTLLRKRWTDFDSLHPGSTGGVLELLPAAFGFVQYWGFGSCGAA